MKSTESKTNQIINKVDNILSSYISAGRPGNILTAFSAGPDSTVLLDVLFRLKEKYSIKIAAAYYNHRLREETEIAGEIEIAEKYCRSRGIRLFLGEDSEGFIRKMSSDSGVEAAARTARYAYLNKVAEENCYSFIATAHNLDDNIETIIMRFFSGSGPEGLKGIAGKTDKLIRPLLDISKKEILEYLEENNIKYSVDSTNNNNDYLRNRIRNQLLPSIKSIFPGFENSLLDLSEKMAFADDFITEETDKKIIWVKNRNYLETDYNNFINLPPCIRLKALYNAFNITDNNNKRLSYNFLKPVTRTNIDSRSPVLLESHSRRLERQGNSLFWKTDIVIGNKNSYLLHIKTGREYKLPDSYQGKNIYISANIVNISQCGKNDIWLPVNKVSGTIQIRNRKPGDYIITSNGTKKLKKLFQEAGIDRDIRESIPLICDNSGILAVWGAVFNYNNRIAGRIHESGSNENTDVILFKSRQG
ncbi:MAG: tRNA lysidine(34) synthetase TilS [Spirochaetia bacterium]|jgi:tRNA(Ile)-lysidine synthase|nr:tRNA lysidine(34) synthetase TilS [Spirochaetia bacterium]